MKTTDDEAVSLAEITDLAWAFVKDRFPQREARARLATALGALMGGSYRQLEGAEPHPLATSRPPVCDVDYTYRAGVRVALRGGGLEDRRRGQILAPGEEAREGLAFRGVD